MSNGCAHMHRDSLRARKVVCGCVSGACAISSAYTTVGALLLAQIGI